MLLLIGPKLFFHKYGLAAQTSPELIFHIIKCREQASVLLSVHLLHSFDILLYWSKMILDMTHFMVQTVPTTTCISVFSYEEHLLL